MVISLRCVAGGLRKIIFLMSVGFLSISWAQQPLQHDVYEEWRSLKEVQLSPDGDWLGYRIQPAKGDGWLVATSTTAPFDSVVIDRGKQLAFAPERPFFAAHIVPWHDSVVTAKREGVKKPKLPKDSLVVYDLDNDRQWKTARLVSFAFPEEKGHHIAYLQEPEKVADTSAADTLNGEDGWLPSPAKKDQPNKGQRLVVLRLDNFDTVSFPAVSAYQWSDEGRLLAFVSEGDSTLSKGLFVYDVTEERTHALLDSAQAYQQLVWDKEGEQLLFFAHHDTTEPEQPVWQLYRWTTTADTATVWLDTSQAVLPEGWTVSPHEAPQFEEGGRVVYLGIAPLPPVMPEDSLGDFEQPKVDVWSWTDDVLMPRQLERKKAEMERTYWARWDGQALVQLADSSVRQLRFTPFFQGRHALGIDDTPYLKEQSWAYPWRRDAYLVDCKTGQRQPIATGLAYGVQISPFGRFITWYDDRDTAWVAYDIRKATTRKLSVAISHPIYREDHDAPHPARPYGLGGWLHEDEGVLLYDAYDIWLVDPRRPDKAVNLTQGVGRATETEYRVRNLRKDTTWIDTDRPLYLEAFCEKDKANGYLTYDWTSEERDTLTWGAQQVRGLRKATTSSVVAWQQGDFIHYPEVHVQVGQQTYKRSVTNPQQSEYAWGSAELMRWTDFSGKEREGLLYLPANFDSTKQYPLLVYYYEQVSDNLHRHYIPSPSRSVINPAMYASNGYVIFMPNIHYQIGYPGKSAYDAIMSGTQAVLARGFVDADRMGLQGQSWGGYQTAYMVTQTNRFAAAMAGAPVANMFSAYGGIRWGSGLSRSFQYERSQSRIGATPWENPHLYWQNSPVFFADQVETPLLMMHNDDDGAVPWYQGIELFVALRRLDKPVWLLNYNGDKHNLRKWPNRVDLSIRMQQFFDHYLKGKQAPSWMTSGVPALQKGQNYGYD